MKKGLIFLLIFISFLAAACAGNGEVNLEDKALVSTPTIIQATYVADNEDIVPTQKPDGDSGYGTQNQTGLVSECTLVSSTAEHSSAYADLFSVTETDWVLGPEDAAVTLIEYGDFQ